MKKILIATAIIFALCFTGAAMKIEAQAPDQNQILQQYLQSKQQQQAEQQAKQAEQQNQQSTAQAGLSKWQMLLLVVYSITILLAWSNLVLGIIAIGKWLKQKKSPQAVVEKRLM